MPAATELEIFVVSRKLVAIEHDLDLATVAQRATEHLMLTAVAEFAQVGEWAIGRGHAGIVFLDPPAHFCDQRLLQVSGVAEQAFDIVVFRFQILANIGAEDGGIAQHLLPIRILQPRIVVGDRDAMVVKECGRRGAIGAACEPVLRTACVNSNLVQSQGPVCPALYIGANSRIARYAVASHASCYAC